MAKWEIHKRLGIPEDLWWRFMPGTVITVQWPVGTVSLVDRPGVLTSWQSADPNDHYRPWLEKYVGKQGWDWEWRLGTIPGNFNNGMLDIKFRKGKGKYATMAVMRWG